MTAISPTANFDLYLSKIAPSGVDTRLVNAVIGGGLQRAIDKYGLAGMPADTIAVGLPAQPLPAIPAGTIVMGVAPLFRADAYPAVSTDPGSPNDELDDVNDDKHIDIMINVAKVLNSYQILKDWCNGLGGTWEPLPVRPGGA